MIIWLRSSVRDGMHNFDPFTIANTAAGSDNHLGLYSYDWLYAHAQSDVYISKTNPVSYPTRIRYVTQSQRVKIREWGWRHRRRFSPVMDPDQSPRVKYDDVMSDDESLHIWLSHIVSSFYLGFLVKLANIYEVGSRILLCWRRSYQPRGHSISHRADCIHQEHPLWYVP